MNLAPASPLMELPTVSDALRCDVGGPSTTPAEVSPDILSTPASDVPVSYAPFLANLVINQKDSL